MEYIKKAGRARSHFRTDLQNQAVLCSLHDSSRNFLYGKKELIEHPYGCSNRPVQTKQKDLLPAIHRQQVFSAAQYFSMLLSNLWGTDERSASCSALFRNSPHIRHLPPERQRSDQIVRFFFISAICSSV
ncbi:MAG: hypothetical protein ACI4MP_03135 [Candidatus Ventricola sp.]